MRHVKHTLLTAPALIVTLGALATATAQANVITCSNGQTMGTARKSQSTSLQRECAQCVLPDRA